MKHLYFIILLISLTINAQDFDKIKDSLKNKYEYIGYRTKYAMAEARTKKGKYTLLNSKGKELFSPKYNHIYITPTGWLQTTIKIAKTYKRGYINKDGSQRIPIIYDDVYLFDDKTIRATLNSKIGILDTLGNTVIPLKYDEITHAAPNYYFIKSKGLYALYHHNTAVTNFIYKEVSGFTFGNVPVIMQDNTATVIDTSGRILFTPIKGHKIIRLFKEYGIIKNNKSEKYGIIDLKGIIKLPCKYTYIEPAVGNFIVTIGKYSGVANLSDKLIIPIEFDNILDRNNGLFLVLKSNKWGVINSEGIEVLNVKYKKISIHKDKYILATNEYDKTGVFDLTGNTILPFTYKFYSLVNNTALCSDGLHCYWLYFQNSKPPLISLFEDADSFKDYGIFDYEQNGYHIFKKGGKSGLVYLVRKNITVAAIYDDISPIYATSEYIMKYDGKYGIINAHNEIIEPLIYDEIILKKESMVLKSKGNKDKIKELNYRGLPED